MGIGVTSKRLKTNRLREKRKIRVTHFHSSTARPTCSGTIEIPSNCVQNDATGRISVGGKKKGKKKKKNQVTPSLVDKDNGWRNNRFEECLVGKNVNNTAAGSNNLSHCCLIILISTQPSSPLNGSSLHILIVIPFSIFPSLNVEQIFLNRRRLGSRLYRNGEPFLFEMIQVWFRMIFHHSKTREKCPSLLRDCGEDILVASHCDARKNGSEGTKRGWHNAGRWKNTDRICDPECKKLHADRAAPICFSH